MALSKAAKKRKKTGTVNTGCMALSYEANKGAAYSASPRQMEKRGRKAAKQNLRDPRNW